MQAPSSSCDTTEVCGDRGSDYLLSSESASINATLILLTSSTNDLCLSSSRPPEMGQDVQSTDYIQISQSRNNKQCPK